MDLETLRLAIAKRQSLDYLDPRAVSLDRAIAGTVPTLLALLEQTRANDAQARLTRAAEKEAARLQAPGWFLW